MDKEQLIKDVIRWIITTKNTEMLDESDVDLVYKDYVTEKVVNVPQADSVQPLLADVRTGGSLANKLSNCVHDNCKDVPHDIGLKLISIVREHLV